MSALLKRVRTIISGKSTKSASLFGPKDKRTLVWTKQYVKVMRTANAYRRFKLVRTSVPYKNARMLRKRKKKANKLFIFATCSSAKRKKNLVNAGSKLQGLKSKRTALFRDKNVPRFRNVRKVTALKRWVVLAEHVKSSKMFPACWQKWRKVRGDVFPNSGITSKSLSSMALHWQLTERIYVYSYLTLSRAPSI